MTPAEKRQDSDAASELAWWEERRRCAPNLHAVIDAAHDRLSVELDRGKRDRLEGMLVGLSQFQRMRYEISPSDRDEQIRLIRAL